MIPLPEKFAHAFRTLRYGSDRGNARGALSALVGDYVRVENESRRLSQYSDAIVLGNAVTPQSRTFELLDRLDHARRSHQTVQGATGSGKSYGELSQAIAFASHGCAEVYLDFKGEGATDRREVMLPAVFSRLNSAEREKRIRQSRVIAPFRDKLVVALNPLAPAPPDVQRVRIEATADAIDDDGTLSDRGRSTFSLLARLVASTCGATGVGGTIEDVAEMVDNEPRFAFAVARCPDEALARQAASRIPAEPRAILYAIRARLDRLLSDPTLAAMLTAPTCLSLGDALDEGTTVIDLSRSAFTTDLQLRLVSNLVIRDLLRAALSRSDDLSRPATRIIFDEFVAGFTAEIGSLTATALMLLRSKAVFLTFLAQDITAVSRTCPQLVPVLLQNCDTLRLYRSTRSAAAPWAAHLPRGGAGANPGDAASAIPTGTCLFLDRRRFTSAIMLRSPRIDLDALRREADSLSNDERDRIRRGSWAVPVSELVASRVPPLPSLEIAAPPDSDGERSRSSRRGRRPPRADGFLELG